MTQSGPPLTQAESVALDLYIEHLEEAAFLYEQRRDVLLDDPELGWTDLADTEERLEAHLDALVLGGHVALALCQQQAVEGGAGALYAALCVFCRQQRKDLLDEVLGGVQADDEERVLAVRDALAIGLPEAWADTVVGWLSHSDLWRQRVAAYVAGYRRLPVSQDLAAALPTAPPEARPEMLWALGRVSAEAERSVIWGYLRHERAAVRAAAALALLRLGGQAAAKHVAVSMAEPWAMLLLGVCGGAEQGAAIQERIEADGATPEGILALGLLGDPQSVDLLLLHIQKPEFAEYSALALHLLTGADLVEDVFVPEEIDEDELFEDELEAFRRGELPTRPDGEPYGTTIVRLSQDPDTWKAWWQGQKGRFQSGVRYRLGEPCVPMSVVRSLESEKMPRRMRHLLGEELIIRYGLEAYCEADAVVSVQRRGIGEWRQQATQHESRFQPGRWYLAGRSL